MTAIERYEINRWPQSQNLTGQHITCDLDDVLGDYMQGFLDFYNARNGTRFLKSDLITYDLAGHLGEDPHTIDHLVDQFATTEEYANMRVTSGAYGALINIKDQGAKLTVLTSRFEKTAEETGAWICANYPGIFSDIVYANGMGHSKGDLARKLGSNLHIDDALKHLNDVRRQGIGAVAFSAPWNHNWQLGQGRYRASTFVDVEQIVPRAILSRSKGGLYLVENKLNCGEVVTHIS